MAAEHHPDCDGRLGAAGAEKLANHHAQRRDARSAARICVVRQKRPFDLTIPLISNEPVNIGEKRLFEHELGEFFHEGP